jgi:hypothetical protein
LVGLAFNLILFRPAIMFMIGLGIYLNDVARRRRFKRLMEKLGQRSSSN